MPVPQRLIADRLGWHTEYPVAVGGRFPGLPTCYKVDVANPSMKIAIEVDGASHKSLRVKEQDTRKDAYLQSLGWQVLRFWNHEILRDLDSTVERVQTVVRSITSKQEPATTSPTVS